MFAEVGVSDRNRPQSDACGRRRLALPLGEALAGDFL